MNDKSSQNWISLSDPALVRHIGVFVKHHRLLQNRTQDDLAAAAGLSRSTLSLLERGETVTLTTLLQVLRVLDLLGGIMDAFAIDETISPLALARLQKEKRKRARGTRKESEINPDW